MKQEITIPTSTTNDPIADLLTRIRNAQAVGHETTIVRYSKLKHEVAKILVKNGYLADAKKVGTAPKFGIELSLSYTEESSLPKITELSRSSKPGKRLYKSYDELRPRQLGFEIISTSRGLMTDRDAKKQKIGGEVLCYVR